MDSLERDLEIYKRERNKAGKALRDYTNLIKQTEEAIKERDRQLAEEAERKANEANQEDS